MTHQRAREVMARLERFASLERQACDETDWIALAYSCSRGQAARMIETARYLTADRTEPADKPL